MADSGLRVHLASGSRAEDAGYQTAADIALLCAQAGIEYRLIGGLAVSIIHAAHGAPGDLPTRQTADDDLGAEDHAVAARGLDALLLEQGYRQTQGNRFVKGEGVRARTIDILIPSTGGQLATNVPCGPLTVDAIPGPSTGVDDRLAPSGLVRSTQHWRNAGDEPAPPSGHLGHRPQGLCVRRPEHRTRLARPLETPGNSLERRDHRRGLAPCARTEARRAPPPRTTSDPSNERRRHHCPHKGLATRANRGPRASTRARTQVNGVQ